MLGYHTDDARLFSQASLQESLESEWAKKGYLTSNLYLMN